MNRPAVALAIGLGAAVALALVLLPERAPSVHHTTLDAATLRGWLGPGAEIEEQEDGAHIRRARDPACGLLVVPVSAARGADLSGLNAAIRTLPSPTIACHRWQSETGHRIQAADRQPASIRPGDDVPPMDTLGRLGLGLAAALIGDRKSVV